MDNDNSVTPSQHIENNVEKVTNIKRKDLNNGKPFDKFFIQQQMRNDLKKMKTINSDALILSSEGVQVS